ncbi:MAG: phage baseplate assembly protein V [Bacteroidota bacterium]
MIRTSISIGGNRLSNNDFTSVVINQMVGGHHTFTIRLRQDANRGVLLEKSKSWIGQTVKIGIDKEEDTQIDQAPVKDVFIGIVTSMGLSRQSGTGLLVVHGESPTIVLDDGPNTRSFTDKGLQEIVDEVLSPYTGSFASAPSILPKNHTASKPYCVQYKESNFAFLARLANRYGEWFYYNGLKLFFGKPGEGDIINLDFGEDGLTCFDISVKAIPTKFEMRGYDYTTHKPLIEEAPERSKSNELGQQVLDISKGQIFTETPSVSLQTALDEAEFKNIVERREQISIDEMVLFSGSSRNAKLKVGATIEVKDNELGESYGAFVLTNITHDIGQGGDYHNTFEAIPVEVKTPPLSTMPTPPFCETQLAKVTNVDDEDSLGRVKVEFLWQEGSGEKSPWIRVAAPYTGKDKGFYVIPEVGDQVLVAFENNNPDKPYVLTGMYNGDAVPEWFDPKNHYKGFKSKGKNQWKFDDKNQNIAIHAPHAITMSAGKKITIKTGGKEDSEITVNAGEGTINVLAKTINIIADETVDIQSTETFLTSSEKTEVWASEMTLEGEKTIDTKTKNMKMEASVGAELKGAKVTVEGSATVDVKSTGPLTAKGMPIKLN